MGDLSGAASANLSDNQTGSCVAQAPSSSPGADISWYRKNSGDVDHLL